MKDNLRNVLNQIKANDELKIKTVYYLQKEVKKRSHTNMRINFRFATACAAFLLFILIGGFSYFSPNAYVDMDVNPSIGLTLNRFGTVIDATSYNDEGSLILQNVNIKFKKYNEVAQMLLDAIISHGYLLESGLVSVTVQTGNSSMENNMLSQLNEAISGSLTTHHMNVQTDIYSVAEDVRNNAHNHHITPAKYLAIIELQAVDSTTTFEDCTNHSISELKKLTQQHGENNNHNNLQNNTNHHSNKENNDGHK